MRFEDCPVAELKDGYILAHSLRTDNITFKKGREISVNDIQQLQEAGINTLTVAILEENDVHEDTAAAFLSEAINDTGLEIAAPFTGRVNIIAKETGILTINQDAIINFNMVDEGITIATLPNHSFVQTKQLVATIKIIPFAVAQSKLDQAIKFIQDNFLKLNLLKNKKVTLIQTELSSVKSSVLDKTTKTLAARLHQLNATIINETRVAHHQDEVSRVIAETSDTDLIILTGASAITDRRDIIPAALEAVGGQVEQYGMPVDPGNLLMLGRLNHIPVIAMPGCARSPKLNGFDWVLQRVCADIPITKKDLAGMSIGGLLKEIPSRPAPRHAGEQAKLSGQSARFGVILLAAGQSRRMGKANKLLATYQGRPLLNHALDCITKTEVDNLIIVTGHEADQASSIISEYGVKTIHNPDYESGIASSLKAGIAQLPLDCDAAMICLSDMPLLDVEDLRKIFASYSEEDGREICIPTYKGKRGNPVLIGKRFFPEIMELSGDIGAKPLISAYPNLVCEVAMDNDAILVDTDTPEALEKLHTR